MKKVLNSKVLLCVWVCTLVLSSCNKEEHHEPIGKTFIAEINIDLDGVTDEGSMTKARESSPFGQGDNDLYAIQIKDNESAKVAGGLFTGAFLFSGDNTLEVALEHGKQYSIEATLVIGAENVLTADVQGESFKKYGAPFSLKVEETRAAQSIANCLIHTNVSDWTNTNTICDFVDLSSQTDENIEYATKDANLRPGDRWYFKKDITADYQNPGMTIDLRRLSVKLVYNITNLQQGYSVKSSLSTDAQGEQINFDVSNEDEKIFTMLNIGDIYTKISASEAYEIDGNLNLSVFDQAEIKSSSFAMKLKANHYYSVNFNADLQNENGIGITTDDTWQAFCNED